MGTSRTAKRAWTVGIAASLLTLAIVPLVLAATSSRAGVASGGTRPASGRPPAGFAWLDATRAPARWAHLTTASSHATLYYPPTWTPIPGDPGTVTVALRDSAGLYVGYLNVTPRQGPEQPHGWAAFRTRRNSEDGDRQVRTLAAAEGLHFLNARGSCVIDDYLSKVGSHPYRELACIVTGAHGTNVFIGAALERDWHTLGATIGRAAGSLRQR